MQDRSGARRSWEVTQVSSWHGGCINQFAMKRERMERTKETKQPVPAKQIVTQSAGVMRSDVFSKLKQVPTCPVNPWFLETQP